jgi:hypothetical protein
VTGNPEVGGDVVHGHAEPWVSEQVGDVLVRPGAEVVETDHLCAGVEEDVAQMGAEEPGATGDHEPRTVEFHPFPFFTDRPWPT